MAILKRALVLTLVGLASAAAPHGQERAAADRHVVLVSIDGFAAFHLDNQAIDLPNIRALAAAGARATTSQTVFPSVTHPSHTTLITGATPREHGVTNNRIVDRRTGQRLHITNLPRRESIRVPTLFDAVHGRGLGTAAFFWPETKQDAAIDDNFAEVFDANEMADRSALPARLAAELRDAGVPLDSYFDLYDDAFTQGAADVALTRAAAHVLRTRKPALLALHLLVADKVQHDAGPEHYMSRTALTTADYCVGLLRKAVEEAGLGARTTFVIAADHGFVTVRDEMNIAPLVREPSLEGRVRWQADGWYAWGELLPSFDRTRDQGALDRVLNRLRTTPGIARIVGPGEFASLGYPDYQDNPFVPGQYLVAATIDTHLVLDARSDSTARRPRSRVYHGHGYLPDAPQMGAALVLSGRGIRRGVSLGATRNVDVAPTIARLLDVSLSNASGRILDAALD